MPICISLMVEMAPLFIINHNSFYDISLFCSISHQYFTNILYYFCISRTKMKEFQTFSLVTRIDQIIRCLFKVVHDLCRLGISNFDFFLVKIVNSRKHISRLNIYVVENWYYYLTP